jgi:hypothetical protein
MCLFVSQRLAQSWTSIQELRPRSREAKRTTITRQHTLESLRHLPSTLRVRCLPLSPTLAHPILPSLNSARKQPDNVHLLRVVELLLGLHRPKRRRRTAACRVPNRHSRTRAAGQAPTRLPPKSKHFPRYIGYRSCCRVRVVHRFPQR